jgi:hypothetical protein
VDPTLVSKTANQGNQPAPSQGTNELTGANPNDLTSSTPRSEETRDSLLNNPAVIEEGLSETDKEMRQQSAELFVGQILNQETTPELLQSTVEKFSPEMSKAILGLTVHKTVETAVSAEAAGIYTLSLDFMLDSLTQGKVHLAQSLKLQFPHENGSGVVEQKAALAEDANVEAPNVLIYATCAKENCSEALVMIRVLSGEGGEGSEDLGVASYKFVDGADGVGEEQVSLMQINATSVGMSNFKSFEQVESELAALAAGQEQTPTQAAPVDTETMDDGSTKPLYTGSKPQRRPGKPSEVRGETI